MLTIRELGTCTRCGAVREDNEIVHNFEMCNECFDENCPCNINKAYACPLHSYPDVVLEF